MTVPALLLLGQPQLVSDTTTYLRSTKPNLLAWYLAAHPGQLFTRAQLTSIFWEQTPEAAARAALSTTLNRLRRALPVWPLVSEGDLLGWQEHPGLAVDLSRFLHLSGLPSPTLAELSEAVGLWRGPFLQSAHLPDSQLFEEWLRGQRAHLEEQVLRLFGQLLPLSQAAGAWQPLIAQARQALSINPYHEGFHRYLMQGLYQSGDRNAALTHYRSLEGLLQTELQISPQPATVSLRDAMLAEQLVPEAVVQPAAVGGRPRGATPTVVAPPCPANGLVGRGVELAQLDEALRQPAPRLLFVRGEAGIGKTTLVGEVSRRQRQGTVLLGRCYPGFADLPFAPFLEALTPVVQGAEASWRRLPDLWLAEVARLLPELAVCRPNLVGQAPAFEYRSRLLEALTRFISCLPPPILLVLEDVHWADDSTLQLLAYLARQHPHLPLHLLVTLRAEETPERVNQLRTQLRREGQALEIPLGPFTQAELGELLVNRTGRPQRRLAARLYQETRGHPLYTSELLQALAETNQLQGSPPAVLPLPQTVQGVIEQRLSRLGPQVRRLLTALAIYPRGAPVALLEPLLSASATSILTGIEAAITAGLIQEGQGEQEAHLTFTHGLIRRVVLSGASKARQQVLNRRAFECFAQQTPAVGYTLAQAKELAHHATAGGLFAEGFTWSQRAADLAADLFSYAEATQLLEQALRCSSHLGTEQERLEREVDLRVKIARIGQFYHRPGRRVQWLAPAHRAAKTLGDAERITEVNLTRAESWLLGGRVKPPLQALEQMLPELRQGPQRCQALYLLGSTYAMQGRTMQAEAMITELEAHLPARQTPFNLLVRSFRSYTYTSLGEFEASQALLQATLIAAHQHGFYPVIANTLTWFARLELQRGNWVKGQARAEAAIAVASRADHPWYHYCASEQLASALIKQGDAAGCLSAVEESLTLGRRAGTPIFSDRLYSFQAEALIALGHLTEARATVAKGLQVAQRLGSLFGLALNQRQEARLFALQGDRLAAQRSLSEALATLTEQRAWPAVARCHAELGALLTGQPEASYHLSQAQRLKARLGIIEL